MKKIQLRGRCDHNKPITMTINLPVKAAVLDAHECDERFQPQYIVWLKTRQGSGKPHYLTTVTSTTSCRKRAKLVAVALNKFLSTGRGQAAALDLIKHDLKLYAA